MRYNSYNGKHLLLILTDVCRIHFYGHCHPDVLRGNKPQDRTSHFTFPKQERPPLRDTKTILDMLQQANLINGSSALTYPLGDWCTRDGTWRYYYSESKDSLYSQSETIRRSPTATVPTYRRAPDQRQTRNRALHFSRTPIASSTMPIDCVPVDIVQRQQLLTCATPNDWDRDEPIEQGGDTAWH